MTFARNSVGPIPGLAEKRPSVLQGDPVFVQDNVDNRWYQGFVHKVELEFVGLKFGSKFTPTRQATHSPSFTTSCSVQSLTIIHREIIVAPNFECGSKFAIFHSVECYKL